MEFEFKGDGTMRYANNSGYRGSGIIRKKVVVSPAIIKEVQKIVRESKIVEEDDEQWPEPDDIGRQELEVKDGEDHIAFTCTKLGSTRDIRDSKDPKGLEALYFLVQDLKCLALSLISLHFKVNPIPN
ncbi:MAGO2 [Symbiodinium sp. KB8]|nr:MAGO2 [Symbiodinium sp. KB8]